MKSPLDQPGVLAVVLERFQKQRLPRILDIKESVDRGETLDDFDIEFLEQVFEDTRQYEPFVDEHPEFQKLFATVAHLYHTIASEALDNETRTAGNGAGERET